MAGIVVARFDKQHGHEDVWDQVGELAKTIGVRNGLTLSRFGLRAETTTHGLLPARSWKLVSASPGSMAIRAARPAIAETAAETAAADVAEASALTPVADAAVAWSAESASPIEAMAIAIAFWAATSSSSDVKL
jgi:hypothetical protein